MLELTSGINSVFTSVVSCVTGLSVVVVVVTGPVNAKVLVKPKLPKDDFARRKLSNKLIFWVIRLEMNCVLAGEIVGAA